IDLRTLSGIRDIGDLDDLILRGGGWALSKQAAERLLCDSALVATLFAGKNRVLDVNDAAMAARDRTPLPRSAATPGRRRGPKSHPPTLNRPDHHQVGPPARPEAAHRRTGRRSAASTLGAHRPPDGRPGGPRATP